MVSPILLLTLSASLLSAREVAITIDDLPRGGDIQSSAADTARMTAKLLEPFRRGHIPLTGFVNECRHPEGLREILRLWTAAGASLGNHTCSHMDLNTATAAEYQADIAKGEPLTTSILGHRPRYFRHPFLHTGNDEAKKKAVLDYLAGHSYHVAPVTLDNSDYMYAAAYAISLAEGDRAQARRIRREYVAYLESIFEFFEKRSVEVTGHEIRQVLLIHASQLNADALPDLLKMMKRRGYKFVSLDRALEDEAYALPETYAGKGGFSWIHRWAISRGLPPKGEPDEPAWLREWFNGPRTSRPKLPDQSGIRSR